MLRHPTCLVGLRRSLAKPGYYPSTFDEVIRILLLQNLKVLFISERYCVYVPAGESNQKLEPQDYE
jgi:hypothetical protein